MLAVGLIVLFTACGNNDDDTQYPTYDEQYSTQGDMTSYEVRSLFNNLQRHGEYSITDIEEIFGRDAELSTEGDNTNTYNIYFGWGRVVITMENATGFAQTIRLDPTSYNWFVNSNISFPEDFAEIFDETDVNEMTREWAIDLFGAEPYYYSWSIGVGLDGARIVWSDGNTWFRQDGMMVQAGQR